MEEQTFKKMFRFLWVFFYHILYFPLYHKDAARFMVQFFSELYSLLEAYSVTVVLVVISFVGAFENLACPARKYFMLMRRQRNVKADKVH